MRYKVKITPVALADIRDSINYYNAQQNGLGTRFSSSVSDAIAAIRSMPQSASFAYEDVRYKLVKKFPFVIIYKVEGKNIVIARVFHTSRQPSQ